MKAHVIGTAVLLIFFASLTHAQTPCDKMITDADRAVREKHYRDAILKYNAARECDPSKKKAIDQKVLAVFALIEDQRDDAIRAREQLRQANGLIRAERDKARDAEQEANRQALIADRAAMANANAALALQSLRHDPTRALRIAEYNKQLFPDTRVSEANFYQLLGDTSLSFYMRRHNTREPVRSLAASPDGKWMAAGLADGTIQLYSTTNDEVPARSWSASEHRIQALTFSPDSRYLLSAGTDRIIRLWDIEQTGPPYRIYAKRDKPVNSLAFHPDGTSFAIGTEEQRDGTDGLLQIWSVADTSAPQASFTGCTSTITVVQYSPDGTKIAAGGYDNAVTIWASTQPDTPATVLTGHAGDVLSFQFSKDGKYVFSGDGDGLIFVWDLDQPEKPVRKLEAHAHAVLALSLSDDGKFLLSGSADNNIHLWEPLKRTAPIRTYRGHTSYVRALACIPGTTQFWSGGEDMTLRKWSTEARPSPSNSFPAAPGRITGMGLLTSTGDAVYSSTDGYLRVFERRDGVDTVAQAVAAHQLAIEAMALSPDKKQVATAGFDGEIKIWSLSPEITLQLTIPPTNARPLSLAFAPKQDFLAAGMADSAVYIWNLKVSGKQPVPLRQHVGRISTLEFSPTGRWLAVGSEDNTISLWAFENGKPTLQQTWNGHASDLTDLAFGPGDSTLYSGSLDGTIRVWNINAPNSLPRVLTCGTADNSKISTLTPIGQTPVLAAGAADGQVRIWQLNTESVPYWAYTNADAGGYITALAATADGKQLIAGFSKGQLKFMYTPNWFLDEQVAPVPVLELLENGFLMPYDSLLRVGTSNEGKAVVAKVLFQQGRYGKALPLWEILLKQAPQPDYYLGWYETQRMLQKDVSPTLLEIDSLPHLNHFARYFMDQGKWDLAGRFYSRMCEKEIRPDHLAGLYEACLRANDLPDTLFHALTDARSMDFTAYGLSQINKAADDERIQVLSDMIGLMNRIKLLDSTRYDPWYANIFCWNIANAYMRRGEYEKAYARMEEGIGYYPDASHLITTLPGNLVCLERFEEAQEVLNTWKDREYDPRRNFPKYQDAFIYDLENLVQSGRLNARQLEKVRTYLALLKGAP